MDERALRLACITLALDARKRFHGCLDAAETAFKFASKGRKEDRAARLELFRAAIRCDQMRLQSDRGDDFFVTLEKLWSYVDGGEVAELGSADRPPDIAA